jgi:hypothetical protein
MRDKPNTPPNQDLSRRDLVRSATAAAVALAIPAPLMACASRTNDDSKQPDSPQTKTLTTPDPDHARLTTWTTTLRQEGLTRNPGPIGPAAARVGELAIGTPYVAFTLEEYLKAGGSPSRTEPLTLSLTKFDCVSLVESCLAVSRVARHESLTSDDAAQWDRFGREMERMRYRHGQRLGYASRLHYFSDWIRDGARRGLARDLGQEFGGTADFRPLRFMSEHRASYPGLADDSVFHAIRSMEQSLDDDSRFVIPTRDITSVQDRIHTGDILAFATSIPGLDVTHAAFAYRDKDGVLRVLHAPLSGGVVEITRSTLPEYVAAIRRSTGILVARPLWG